MIDEILNYLSEIYPLILWLIVSLLVIALLVYYPHIVGAIVIIAVFVALILGMLRAHHII